MKHEDGFLIVFVVLAIYILVVSGRREHLDNPVSLTDPPPDPSVRMSNLETQYDSLDYRVSSIETGLKKQKDQLDKAQTNVSDATASLNQIT